MEKSNGTTSSHQEYHQDQSPPPSPSADQKDIHAVIVEVQENGTVSSEVFGAGNSLYAKIQTFVGRYGCEQRGVEPTPEDERTDRSPWKPGTMFWASNLVVTTFAIGSIGVTAFGLGWWDGFLTILIGNSVSALATAYFATFGPLFGMRQMILSRYWFGYHGVKIMAFLAGASGMIWAALNAMVAAQLIHSVNNNVPGWAAIIAIAAGTLVVTLLGYKVVHYFEMIASIPVFIMFLILLGEFARSGDFEYLPMGKGETEAARVLSFLAAIFGCTLGWAPYAADYSCYQPRNANRTKIFFGLFFGTIAATCFAMMLGFAVATATINNPAYQTAFERESVGGIIAQVLVVRLGGFGKFCMVILALSIAGGNVPNSYSFCFAVQVLAHQTQMIPRVVWIIVANLIYVAIGVAGYSRFEAVLSNFMVCTSYWVAIYVTIAVTEHFVFKRSFSAYVRAAYNQPKKLPPSYAATGAFCFGVFGSVLGMAQLYFIGPIGKLIGGEYGGDLGFPLALGFTLVTYLPCRYFELKHFKR